MRAPPRWLTDPSAPPSLRGDLEQFAAQPAPYDVARGAGDLARTLAELDAAAGHARPDAGDGAAGGAGAEAAAGSGLASGAATWPFALKLVLALAGVGATGALGQAIGQHWLQRGSREAPPSAASGVTPSAAAATPPPSAAAPAKLGALAASVDAAPATHAPRAAAAAASAPSQAAVAPRRQSPSQREIAQLTRIRALLRRDPAAARRLSQAAALEFPAGPLREEREGLAVLAAFASGEREQATREAARFLARYPQSPLRDRIRRASAAPETQDSR